MNVLMMVDDHPRGYGYICRVMDDEDATAERPGTLLAWLMQCRNDQDSAHGYVSWQRSFRANSVTTAVRSAGTDKLAHVYYFLRGRWYVYPVVDGKVGSGLWAGVVLDQLNREILRSRALSIEHWVTGGREVLAGVKL